MSERDIKKHLEKIYNIELSIAENYKKPLVVSDQ